uniref:Uncharacterized protein n=2 Tax=Anguilla anguilla TaxID=7936 RepID=A0A0E9ST87_ANGAN
MRLRVERFHMLSNSLLLNLSKLKKKNLQKFVLMFCVSILQSNLKKADKQ